MTSAYKEGQQAFKDGKGLTTNPYALMTNAPEREQWLEGWYDAKYEKDRDPLNLDTLYVDSDAPDAVAFRSPDENFGFGSHLDGNYIIHDAGTRLVDQVEREPNHDQDIIDAEEEGKSETPHD
jgi:ribosome modulation factor